MNISKNINNFLQLVCDNITYSPIKESVKSELCEHILDGKQNYINQGLDNDVAENKALADMGAPEQISKDFNNLYKRKLDWKMLIIFILLIGINLLLTISIAVKKNDMQYISRNIIYIVTGILMAFILYFVNYKKLQKIHLRYRNFWVIS